MRPGLRRAVAAGDPGAARTLAILYKTERVLVAFAEPDAATGRFAVTLAGRDAVGPFVLTRAVPGGRGRPRLRARVGGGGGLAHARGALEGRQHPRRRHRPVAAPAGGGARPADLGGVSRHGANGRTSAASSRATPGVEELDVAGLSARGARVTLRIADGAERLAAELAQQGLSLRSNGGTWVLSQSR